MDQGGDMAEPLPVEEVPEPEVEQPECWCERCGRGYQVGGSSAHSTPDCCGRGCESADEDERRDGKLLEGGTSQHP